MVVLVGVYSKRLKKQQHGGNEKFVVVVVVVAVVVVPDVSSGSSFDPECCIDRRIAL